MLNCIQTTDKLLSSGYGYSWEGGKTLLSHRKAYANKMGVGPFDLPKGLVVRHTCDNPSCINEDHLIGGSHQDNVDDKFKRGRGLVGEKISVSVLTELQVFEIRKNSTGKWGEQTKMAHKYGVAQQTISKILDRTLWKHI